MLKTPEFDPLDIGLAETRPAQATAVALKAISLRLGETDVLSGIDLSLERGQVLALLGPSGCGKTTVLRLVAGLLGPDQGQVVLDGTAVADPARGLFLPPEARGLGMVFQDYALWPHMSVAANVAFPLEMQGVAAAERRQRAQAALERVGLAAMADRRPSALSGGQQQRVAIARAIVGEPRLVLFDEPLSNLDRELRETMVNEIAGLVADLGLTALYVTHDHSEAFSLAHRVAVMRAGKIEQVAAPEALVDQPANAGVAEFLRLGAVLPVACAADGWHLSGGPLLAAPGVAPEGTARVLLPTRALSLTPAGNGRLSAGVGRVLFRGDGYVATLALEGGHELHLFTLDRLTPSAMVGLDFKPEDLRWFPA